TIRWNSETFFEYDKDLLGSDHYQVMSARAILRFWTLIACLLYFLEELRVLQDLPRFTLGDSRHKLQEQHRLNLLLWLKDQFQANLSIEQISAQLALSNS
ncbi:MAG TPA: hypothetical protein VLA72_19130, partial [Anaerolineales bacterium]|nr:hypothetical protein [Anaerolineales bacterium]